MAGYGKVHVHGKNLDSMKVLLLVDLEAIEKIMLFSQECLVAS